ncbi:hypothetical protein EDF77_1888 [Stenotrophomonas maltophilia]|nr:hypothetical protein [Stenotrophomonas chelatiphaga]MCS4231401.1 hypothetical protein [Stenotrophomonas chelatiphaga]ROQ42416.1 hypothetical protein EDF77_1888 [Stenotrophomonas maltophilia]
MPDFKHLVNMPGGKDSIVVYLRAIESDSPLSAAYADSGIEVRQVAA